MSVINQMLRDLDARQAGEQERAGLPSKLRTLPPARLVRAQNLRMLAIGIGVGVGVAVLVVSLLTKPDMVPAPLPTPTPAPASQPPASAVPPVPPSAASPQIDLGDMKISTLLSMPKASPDVSAPARSAAPSPSPQPVPTYPKPSVAEKPMPVTKPAAGTSVPTPSAEAHIDKRSKDGQARDMAENEYRKGMQAVKRGEGAAALPPLQRALELDPMHAKARQALLSVLVGGRQWAEAQRVAQAGLALEPGQTGWASILARLQFEQGDTAAALETLERHAPYAGNDADYQGLFAYLLQKQQRFAEAAQRFQSALSLRPQEGRWWFGYGLALESAGRGSEARDAYVRAKEAGNLPADMISVVEQKLK